MPDTTTPDAAGDARRADVASVVYWLVAGAIYVGLGVMSPPTFLLGFQEALLYVFLVTVLQPKVLRRLR
jgi:hypothetical protein